MTNRVLYVEDNDENFRLVKRLLEAVGDYEVEQAWDGVAGLARARETPPPDVVLIDLDLPKLSGLEVARELSADPATAKVPLIAVSANVMQGERQRSLDAGCLAFVEKPFDIHQFVDLVGRCIEEARREGT